MEKVKEYKIRTIASSRAIIPSNIEVRLPLALYSCIRLKIAAGAVAAEMAPSRMLMLKISLTGFRESKKYKAPNKEPATTTAQNKA